MVDLQISINGNEWKSLDFDESTSINYIMQVSDYQNPTVVKNNYSTTISLPLSHNNSTILRSIHNNNKIIDNKDYSPILSNKFRLYVDGTIFQKGYFKLVEINGSQYHTQQSIGITLFGDLGNFINLLNDDNFSLKNLFTNEFDHIINKETIVNDWTGVSAPCIDAEGNPILHYIPAYNGEYKGFDNGKISLDLTGADDSIVEVTWKDPNTGIEFAIDSINENSRTEIIETDKFLCGEYRSYYQKPVVRGKYLLNSICNKVSSETEYTMELDPNFFNDNNPYYNNIWFTLNNYNIEGSENANLVRYRLLGDTLSDGLKSIYMPTIDNGVNATTNVQFEYVDGQLSDSTNLKFSIDVALGWATYPYVSGVVYKGTAIWNAQLTIIYNDGSNKTKVLDCEFTDPQIGNCVVGQAPIYQGDGHYYYQVSNQQKYWVEKQGATNNFNNATIHRVSYDGPSGLPQNATITSINLSFTQSGTSKWYRVSNGVVQNDYIDGVTRIYLPTTENSVLFFGDYSSSSVIRSNSNITWSGSNPIFTEDIKASDFILSYMKMFGLMLDVDINTNKATLMSRNKWYSKQRILDWTSKIDYSKDYITEIWPYEYRYGEFKHLKNETKISESYFDSYSIDYGSFKFNTNNQNSNTTEEMIKNGIFKGAIFAQDILNKYKGRSNAIFLDNKNLLYQQTDETSGVQSSMQPVFINNPWTENIIQILPDTNKWWMSVSDDTPSMVTSQNFNWLEANTANQAYYTLIQSYTRANMNYEDDNGTYSLYYGIPQKEYEANEIEVTPYSTLYQRFYSAYVEDRYDVNNRVLKCSVLLKNSEVTPELLKSFIWINGSIWVLNKVGGFNPLNYESTKVELIKVQNIQNYLLQDYVAGNGTVYSTIKYGNQVLYRNWVEVDNTITIKNTNEFTITINNSDWDGSYSFVTTSGNFFTVVSATTNKITLKPKTNIINNTYIIQIEYNGSYYPIYIIYNNGTNNRAYEDAYELAYE